MAMATSKSRPLRADAARSIAAIVAAGLECFRTDPHTTMSAIAREAGVSRVTLYTHFPTREALLEQVVELSVSQAAEAVEAEHLDDGPAPEALKRLIHSSWQTLDRHLSLYAAASTTLPPARLRAHHSRVLEPVHALLERGQREGTFRTDLPLHWLVTVLYTLMHAAAEEVQSKTLPPKSAPDTLTATLLASLRPPAP